MSGAGKNRLNRWVKMRRFCVWLDAAPALAHLEGMTICTMVICKRDCDRIRRICITC